MRKRIISICVAAILILSICGCARTAEDTLAEEMGTVETANTETESEEGPDIEGEAKTNTDDAGTTVNGEAYGQSEEETVSQESAEGRDETDTESEDILREIDEYRSHFIGLYTSNALNNEFPDLESGMIIEEHGFPSDSGEGASVTVYSDLSGKKLRYELHYYGETGNNVINYYLCDNFVWVSRQYNCYSSMTLRAGYSDVLYSTMENWIFTEDAVYIMHDNGELEETDKTQLENEFPMPKEIKAMEMGYSQADTIADIKDITWETVDYNVVDLHFHLEDGSVIDREIIGYSVLDIVYEDITGDDAYEVLIYCDFANNTCDWQLVYFYQIDRGNVSDISPSSKDIPELKSNEGYWNTWIAVETMEGYSSHIYTLESYYKENGIMYVEETLYIGYKNGKWELVQGFDESTAADFFYYKW